MGDDEELGSTQYDGETEIPVSSSAISSVRYDQESQTLNITFTGGREYELAGVDKDVVDELISSPSPGSFFNSRMRGRY
jgi:hypothetical protein